MRIVNPEGICIMQFIMEWWARLVHDMSWRKLWAIGNADTGPVHAVRSAIRKTVTPPDIDATEIAGVPVMVTDFGKPRVVVYDPRVKNEKRRLAVLVYDKNGVYETTEWV